MVEWNEKWNSCHEWNEIFWMSQLPWMNEIVAILNENAFHSFMVAKQIFLWQLPWLHQCNWQLLVHEPHLDLQVIVEHELSLLHEARQLLPAQVPRILPNQKSWSEPQAVMGRMPPKKIQAKCAGDPSYGAGERSGKKAKALHPEKPTSRGGERYGSISPEYDG